MILGISGSDGETRRDLYPSSPAAGQSQRPRLDRERRGELAAGIEAREGSVERDRLYGTVGARV